MRTYFDWLTDFFDTEWLWEPTKSLKVKIEGKEDDGEWVYKIACDDAEIRKRLRDLLDKKESEKKNIKNEDSQKKAKYERFGIERVIVNEPAIIVLWKDGDRTVAKVEEDDTFNVETGFAVCVLKHIYGNKKFRELMSIVWDEGNK